MTLDDELRRDDLEHLARLMADTHALGATDRARPIFDWDQVRHVDAWEMIGKRLATALALALAARQVGRPRLERAVVAVLVWRRILVVGARTRRRPGARATEQRHQEIELRGADLLARRGRHTSSMRIARSRRKASRSFSASRSDFYALR
jgi:hypothetical protein